MGVGGREEKKCCEKNLYIPASGFQASAPICFMEGGVINVNHKIVCPQSGLAYCNIF